MATGIKEASVLRESMVIVEMQQRKIVNCAKCTLLCIANHLQTATHNSELSELLEQWYVKLFRTVRQSINKSYF